MTRSGKLDALRLLGLAQRAGAVETGVEATRRAVREGRAELVLLAADASPGQLRKITALLEHRAVPRRVPGDRISLGTALGGPPLSAVAVTRHEFAEPLLRHLAEEAG